MREWKRSDKYSIEYGGENSPHWKGGNYDLKCLYCGNMFETRRRGNRNDRKFCSRSCAGSFNIKKRELKGKYVECVICGTKKYRQPNMIKRGYGKCCSSNCSAIFNIKNQKRSRTDIELIIENWLIENKFDYEEQVPINGICIVDFKTGDNLIFCDGDYWHEKEDVKKRDVRNNKLLAESGYNVIRLKGSEIHAGKRPNI